MFQFCISTFQPWGCTYFPRYHREMEDLRRVQRRKKKALQKQEDEKQAQEATIGGEVRVPPCGSGRQTSIWAGVPVILFLFPFPCRFPSVTPWCPKCEDKLVHAFLQYFTFWLTETCDKTDLVFWGVISTRLLRLRAWKKLRVRMGLASQTFDSGCWASMSFATLDLS